MREIGWRKYSKIISSPFYTGRADNTGNIHHCLNSRDEWRADLISKSKRINFFTKIPSVLLFVSWIFFNEKVFGDIFEWRTFFLCFQIFQPLLSFKFLSFFEFFCLPSLLFKVRGWVRMTVTPSFWKKLKYFSPWGRRHRTLFFI
jgi:hypothetical protein